MVSTITCRPAADGTYKEYQPASPATHYDRVNKEFQDYVYISNTGTTYWCYDTFGFTKPSPQGIIKNILVRALCYAGGDGHDSYHKAVLYHSDHNIKGGSQLYSNMPGNLVYPELSCDVNPWTGEPWSWDDLDDLEFGVGGRCGHASHQGRCDFVYMEITWDYPPACGGAQIIGLGL